MLFIPSINDTYIKDVLFFQVFSKTFASELLKVMNMFVKKIIFCLIFSPLLVDAIIGGEYVTNAHEYPWMVNVQSFELKTSKSSQYFPNPLKIDYSSAGSCGG